MLTEPRSSILALELCIHFEDLSGVIGISI